MKTLIELVAEIVSSHASNTTMTTDQIVTEIQTIHTALKNLENPLVNPENSEGATEQPKESSITVRQAFKKDEVICMVCQKGGFKTLKKHLSTAHQLTPGQYRKQFGIKSSQKLAAKNFSDARRKAAEERGMTDILAKAREKRMSNLKSKKIAAAKPAAKPAKSPRTAQGAGRPKKVSK
ncbi:MAG TPA: MucR family transcriptional regulator [Geobacteraceae bacterium]|nr:MucR family transcriptional regulator [Geobacteraceae bacterium]